MAVVDFVTGVELQPIRHDATIQLSGHAVEIEVSQRIGIKIYRTVTVEYGKLDIEVVNRILIRQHLEIVLLSLRFIKSG